MPRFQSGLHISEITLHATGIDSFTLTPRARNFPKTKVLHIWHCKYLINLLASSCIDIKVLLVVIATQWQGFLTMRYKNSWAQEGAKCEKVYSPSEQGNAIQKAVEHFNCRMNADHLSVQVWGFRKVVSDYTMDRFLSPWGATISRRARPEVVYQENVRE